MNNKNKYDIYLHLDELSDNKSAVAGAGSGSTDTDDSQGGGGDRVVNKLKKMVSFAAVKSTADRIASYKISQVTLKTGAAEYEERLSYIQTAVSQTVGAGAALVAAGMAGGPAGLAVAGLGIATSAVNKLISILQKNNTLQLQESLENVSIGMARVRAGVSGRRAKNQ